MCDAVTSRDQRHHRTCIEMHCVQHGVQCQACGAACETCSGGEASDCVTCASASPIKHGSECVYALAGTTFVQTVTAAALSITVPVLGRGFKEKKTAIQRKCAVITENMAKLVERAADVASMITPVPGGVGPMTIAMLLKNTLNLARHAAGLPRLPLRAE